MSLVAAAAVAQLVAYSMGTLTGKLCMQRLSYAALPTVNARQCAWALGTPITGIQCM